MYNTYMNQHFNVLLKFRIKLINYLWRNSYKQLPYVSIYKYLNIYNNLNYLSNVVKQYLLLTA